MAEEYKGTVIRVVLGGSPSSDSLRMLNILLDRVDGVTSHFLDVEKNILTAYLDDEADHPEGALVSALLTAGVYPKGFSEAGFEGEDTSHVC